MQLGDLDQLVGILSADMHLKMVPGYSWIPDRLTRKITYPRAQLMTMNDKIATGWIFRCVEHCISTFGDLDAYNVGVDAALTIRDIAGVEVIHPRFFLHVVLMAERERVEAIARRRARNLENTYLPRRWQRYRETERIPDRTRLATISPMDKPAEYWERVGLAVALLAAEVITAAELPSDMRWSPDVVARVQRSPTIASYDELLMDIEDLMPAFVRAQLEEHASPVEGSADESESPSPSDTANDPAHAPSEGEEPSDEENSPDGDDANAAADESSKSDSTETDGNDGSASADDAIGDASTKSENNDSTKDSDDSEDDGGTESGEATETATDGDAAGDSDATPLPAPNSGTAGGADSDASKNTGATAAGERDSQPSDDVDAAEGPATTVDAGTTSEGVTNEPAGESLADLIARIAPELLKALEEAIGAEPDGRIEIDFINDDAAADPERPTERYEPPTEDEFRHSLVPAWGAVSRSTINRKLREPLRRTLLKHLIDNEVGDLETGHRSGRLDVRAVARPDPQPQPFRRRQAKADQSYAVGLIADASGSMNASCPEIEHDEAVFGEGSARRWHLTTYIAVALTEALAVIPNTQLTIVTYDTRVSFVKPHATPFSPDVRQKVLRGIIARGENDDAGALTAAIDDLIRATNTTKLLFHLTDGEFCSGQSAIQYQLNRAKKNGITVVFLTLAIEPTSARRFVDAELADRVDPGSIGPVINKHLTRMLRGQRFPA